MLTSTNRQLTSDTRFLAEQAFTGGVDYDWRLGDRYSLSGFWAGSRISGDPAAMTRVQENAVHYYQRPDADYVDYDPNATSLSGHAGSLAVGKIAGEKLRFTGNYAYKSPGFEINDLGFQRRADERTMNHWVQLRDQVPGKYKRQFMVNFNQWAGWNFGGDNLYSGGNVNMHWWWQNNWRAGFGVNGNAGGLRDRATRGGPGVRGNPTLGVWHYIDFDDRRAVFPGYNGFVGGDGQGSMQVEANPKVTWRPSPRRAARGRAALPPQHRRRPVGGERRRRRRRDPLRVRPAAAAHRGHDLPAELHAVAESVVPELRWSRSSRPATTRPTRN